MRGFGWAYKWGKLIPGEGEGYILSGMKKMLWNNNLKRIRETN